MKSQLLTIFLAYIVCSVLATDEALPCFNPNNVRGKCIRLSQCSSLDEVIKKSSLFEDDIAFLRASRCGPTKYGDPLVCCTDEPDDFTVISPFLPTAEMCRERRAPGIFGGERTRLGEYPWMALLEYSIPRNTTGFHCGGSLINDRYILTAAHCVHPDVIKEKKLISVRLGEHQISSDTDCEGDICADPPIDVTIEQQIIHEMYRYPSKQQEHDIALLRLSRPVKYTTYIKPICLPGSTILRSQMFDEEYMDVAGWGVTENSTTSSDFKLKVRIRIVPLSECVRTYRTNPRNTTIGPNQLCAGGEDGKDSCNGDSGGPLLFPDVSDPTYSYWYCIGVVSFGPTKCGQNGIPGIYTRVASYIDWIVNNIHE